MIQDTIHPIVQFQFSVVHQLQDADGGKHFGQAGDGEHRVGSDGSVILQVSPAVASSGNELAVLHDGQGSSGDAAFLEKGNHHRVEMFQTRTDQAGDRELAVIAAGRGPPFGGADNNAP